MNPWRTVSGAPVSHQRTSTCSFLRSIAGSTSQVGVCAQDDKGERGHLKVST